MTHRRGRCEHCAECSERVALAEKLPAVLALATYEEPARPSGVQRSAASHLARGTTAAVGSGRRRVGSQRLDECMPLRAQRGWPHSFAPDRQRVLLHVACDALLLALGEIRRHLTQERAGKGNAKFGCECEAMLACHALIAFFS